jgi:hypothetical protein
MVLCGCNENLFYDIMLMYIDPIHVIFMVFCLFLYC